MPHFPPSDFIHSIESDEDLAWLQALATKLSRRRHREKPPGAPMTETEACNFFSLSREAIRKLRKAPVDPLPCLKAGRRYLYKAEEVERWMRRKAESQASRGQTKSQTRPPRRPQGLGRVPPRGSTATCPPRRVGVRRERAGTAP